jgi:hypothetical protein
MSLAVISGDPLFSICDWFSGYPNRIIKSCQTGVPLRVLFAEVNACLSRLGQMRANSMPGPK